MVHHCHRWWCLQKIDLPKKICDFSDTYAWLFLTWDDGNGLTYTVSSPVASPKSFKTFAMLCENGKYFIFFTNIWKTWTWTIYCVLSVE